MMKRYWLFAGDCYYPGGGWSDFRGSSDDLDELKSLLTEELGAGEELSRFRWWHVADTTTGKYVPGLRESWFGK